MIQHPRLTVYNIFHDNKSVTQIGIKAKSIRHFFQNIFRIKWLFYSN